MMWEKFNNQIEDTQYKIFLEELASISNMITFDDGVNQPKGA